MVQGAWRAAGRVGDAQGGRRAAALLGRLADGTQGSPGGPVSGEVHLVAGPDHPDPPGQSLVRPCVILANTVLACGP